MENCIFTVSNNYKIIILSSKCIYINGVKFDANDSQDWELKANSESSDFVLNILSFCKEWFDDASDIKAKTSGSTGMPKEILLPKKWLELSAKKSINTFGIKPKSNLLLCLPVSFIAGKLMVVRAILSVSNLVCIQPESKVQLPAEEIDFAAFTPMQVQYLIDSQQEAYSKISKVIIGGGAISERLWNSISTLANANYATYGMTETATHIAFQPIQSNTQRGTFRLIDNSIAMKCDERGCIGFNIPYFDDLSIQTNDLAHIIDQYNFEILGRFDRVVNSGGRKIHPDNLENLLENEIQNPFYFCGVPDELLGEKLVLMVEGDSTVFSISQINEKLSMLNKLDRPKEIYLRKEFNYSHTGKLIKKYFDE